LHLSPTAIPLVVAAASKEEKTFVLASNSSHANCHICTSALPGTPSVHSVHAYYHFALEDGGQLAHMAVELVDRWIILAAIRRFHGMGATDSHPLRS
jgi:hypothetical protein